LAVFFAIIDINDAFVKSLETVYLPLKTI